MVFVFLSFANIVMAFTAFELGKMHTDVLARGLIATQLLVIIVSLVLYYFLAVVEINSEGIFASEEFGKYFYLVEWDEMEKIKPIRIMGLLSVRLFFKEAKRPLWIPLFIINKYHDFQEFILKSAPANNVLRNYFDSIKKSEE